MRSLLSGLLAIAAAVSVLAVNHVRPAEANFHCIRIHAVMGGFGGDNNVQYVELRLSSAGQTALTGHKIQFFDASGTLKATFTFPSVIVNGQMGDSVLVATSEFNSIASGGVADFVFTAGNTTGASALHPVPVTGGSVVWAGQPGDFNCAFGPFPVDAVAYGSATAMFGTAAAALPAVGTSQSLRLSNLNTAPTNNSTEYSLQNVATSTFAVSAGNLPTDLTTPRNNGRVVLKLTTPVSVGGVSEQPELAAPAARSSDGGNSDRMLVEVSAGIAAAAITAGAGWYIFRRRVVRS